MHKLKNPRKYVERLKTRIADRWRHKAPWNEGCGMTEHHIPLCAEIDRPTMRRGKCPRFPDAQVFRDYCERCNRRECGRK